MESRQDLTRMPSCICQHRMRVCARGLQANWLKSVGVRKGDAVAIYLPLICELPGAPRPLMLLPGKHDNAQLSWGKLRHADGRRKEYVD